MNTYKKYCPNVFVAKCDQEHQKGDIIQMTTKYGQTHDAIVFNLVGRDNDANYYYSIVRADGGVSQQQISEWLSGKSDLTLSKFIKILTALEINIRFVPKEDDDTDYSQNTIHLN